jgi:hypothetical protein
MENLTKELIQELLAVSQGPCFVETYRIINYKINT